MFLEETQAGSFGHLRSSAKGALGLGPLLPVISPMPLAVTQEHDLCEAQGHCTDEQEVAVHPVHQPIDAAVGVNDFSGYGVAEHLNPLAAH
ncbi:hypothetical protein E2320_004405, partial [Naja naja]